MKHLFSDTGQEATQDSDLREKGYERGEPYHHPSFLPGGNPWTVEQDCNPSNLQVEKTETGVLKGQGN